MAKQEKNNSVTQTDIARELNISVVSVSNALSGRRGVSEELRQRVFDVADELGYKRAEPETAADRESHLIGVLISKRYLGGSLSFYMNMYQEIVRAASDKQIFTLLEILDVREEEQMVIPDMFRNEQVHGILVLGELKKEYTCLLKKQSAVPIVFVDFYADIPDTDFVITNGYQGTCQLTRNLIKAGYRDIAFLGTITATSSIMDRYLGYRKAMMENQLPLRPDRLLKDRKEWDSQIYAELPEELPEAFVCNCDRTALILIEKLRERGILVPRDVGVVGFDHFAPGDGDDMDLDTFEVDCKAMAQISINILMRKARHPDLPSRVRMVSGRIIKGSSYRRKGERTV